MNLGLNIIQELTFLIMKTDKIRYLDLKKNRIGDNGIIILMHAAKRSQSLYHLNLASTDITERGIKRICTSLIKNESVVSLSLGCNEGIYKNRINEKGMQYLTNLLK